MEVKRERKNHFLHTVKNTRVIQNPVTAPFPIPKNDLSFGMFLIFYVAPVTSKIVWTLLNGIMHTHPIRRHISDSSIGPRAHAHYISHVSVARI